MLTSHPRHCCHLWLRRFLQSPHAFHGNIDRGSSGSGGGGLVSGCLLLERVEFGLQAEPTHASSTHTKVKLFG